MRSRHIRFPRNRIGGRGTSRWLGGICGQYDGVELWPVAWDERQGTLRLGPPKSLAGTRGQWARIAICANGKRLLTNLDGLDAKFQVANHTVRACGVRHPDARSVLAVLPDGRLGAVPPRGWRGSGVFEVWDLHQMKLLRQLNRAQGGYHFAVFSPDGRMLVTNDHVKGYIVWDTKSWEALYKFGWHAIGFARAAFSPDSHTLALKASRSRVCLVEPGTGRRLAELEAFSDSGISWVTFSPDGTRLAISSKGQFQIWDLARIRRQLDELGLDWNRPSASSASSDPSEADPQPLNVEIAKVPAR